MVTFTDAHLSQLNTLVGEIPHKFAVPIIHFINVVIAEQQQQKPLAKDPGEGSSKDAGTSEQND